MTIDIYESSYKSWNEKVLDSIYDYTEVRYDVKQRSKILFSGIEALKYSKIVSQALSI